MATAKKGPVKRAPARKTPAKKAPGRKAPAKKAPARKAGATKKASAPAKTRAPKGKVWEYIKKNSLQDKAKRPMINADAKIRP